MENLALLVRPFAVLLIFALIVIPLRVLILRAVPRPMAYRLSRPVSKAARWYTTLGILLFIIACDWAAGLL